MRLESGPAAYDRNYYLIFLLFCICLGAYFLYDYAAGYPNKNLKEAKKRLALLVGPEDVPKVEDFEEEPTKPRFDALVKAQPTDPAAVHKELGQPFTTKQVSASEELEYFASAYGMATVPIVGGRVEAKRMTWTTWHKTKEEIRLQLYCALVTFAIGLYVFYRVYRAATLRAVIDDAGMVYGGRRIPFDSMTRLCDYSRKGWVDLYHQLGGQERKLRIDNQKIRKFDEIIDALCEVKGFEDPRREVEEPQAAAESAESENASAPSDDDASDETAAK